MNFKLKLKIGLMVFVGLGLFACQLTPAYAWTIPKYTVHLNFIANDPSRDFPLHFKLIQGNPECADLIGPNIHALEDFDLYPNTGVVLQFEKVWKGTMHDNAMLLEYAVTSISAHQGYSGKLLIREKAVFMQYPAVEMELVNHGSIYTWGNMWIGYCNDPDSGALTDNYEIDVIMPGKMMSWKKFGMIHSTFIYADEGERCLVNRLKYVKRAQYGEFGTEAQHPCHNWWEDQWNDYQGHRDVPIMSPSTILYNYKCHSNKEAHINFTQGNHSSLHPVFNL